MKKRELMQQRPPPFPVSGHHPNPQSSPLGPLSNPYSPTEALAITPDAKRSFPYPAAELAGKGRPPPANSTLGIVVWGVVNVLERSGSGSFETKVQKTMVIPGQGAPPPAARCAPGRISSA